ncbi:MAG: DUF4406 domain-containing protein [Prevotella sp.]|jgi:hypothetical protein|nr:DUF4406 domain-containing protein [Prevotella sp.]
MRKLKIYHPKEIKTVYISGQITGLELKEAKANFDKAEALLLEKGYNPLNPMKVNPPLSGKCWKEYMLDDITQLFNCEGILLLDNWQDSKGARIEHFIAQEMGMTILTTAD